MQTDRVQHKVFTYVEYRAVSGVFQNIDATIKGFA